VLSRTHDKERRVLLRARTPRRLISLAIPALLLSAPLVASAVDTWVVSSTEKILPSSTRPPGAPAAAAGAALSAAKNEFEAFQIAIAGPATAVSATATALAGPAEIAPPRLFREALIEVKTPSSVDGGTGFYPDALVPDVDDVVGEKRNAFPFDVPAGQTRALWVEIHVPKDAAAGDYHGTVTLHATSGDVAVPVALHVWDFALPSTSSLKSFFAIYYEELPAGHGIPRYGTEDLPLLRARYAQLGLDHRISLSNFDDGHYDDLDHLDRYYGPLIEGTAPTQLQGAQVTSVEFLNARGGTAASQTATAAAWAARFKARGWFDRLFDYTCDEPPVRCDGGAWSDIPARAAMIKAADPAFRTLVTTTVTEATANGVLEWIDVLSPIVNELDGKEGYPFAGPQRKTYDAFVAQPTGGGARKELWTYQSCMSHGCDGALDAYGAGWPTYAIDAPAVRARTLEWQSFIFDVTGELYFAATWAYAQPGSGGAANNDPWANQYFWDGNGDGTLFYPGTPDRIGGKTHIPVASLRLKMIREGMEDFEYLKALSEAGDPELAKTLAAALVPRAWSVPAVASLLATRDAVARRIETLRGRSSLAPVPLGATPGAGASIVEGSGCSAGGAGEVAALLGLAWVALSRHRRRP
jgi:uncharacterized protein (TIGR03382 family)